MARIKSGSTAGNETIATQSWVSGQISSVVAAAPSTLDTLNELAAALGDDPNFATTMTNALAGKASSSHTHTIANITGLQSALDGKQAAGSYLGSTAKAADSNLLDGIDSSSFLRSDAEDTKSGNTMFIGPVWIDNTGRLGESKYTWTNSALTTTSIEIVDDNGNDETKGATLVIHNYGDGGVKFRMGNYGDKTLYLSSAASNGAGSITDDNAGTYFNAVKINNNEVIHAGNIGSQNVNYASSAGSVAWTNVSGKPGSFTPSSHTHPIEEIDGLRNELDGKQPAGNYQAAGSYAPAGGSYGTDWYANALYYDDWVRNHSNNNGIYWSNTGWHLYPQDGSYMRLRSGASGVTGIRFNTAGTDRSYLINDSANNIGFLNTAGSWIFKVDNSGVLQTGNIPWARLSSVPSTFAPSAHSHAISEVSGLQGALDGKASTNHTHSYTDLTNKPTIPTNTNQLTNGAGFLTNGSSETLSYVYRIHANDGTSPDSFGYNNRYQTFNYGVSSGITGPLLTFGGLGDGYPMQITGSYSGGGNAFAVRTRNGDTGSWNTWRTLITDGNIGSQSVNYASSAGNADTVDGWHRDDLRAWTNLTGKPSTFAPSAHTHPIDEIDGLRGELDGKQAAGSYAAASHTHDDRYYTESESLSLFARKDTNSAIGGNLVIGNGTYGAATAYGNSGARLMFSGSDTDAQGNYYIGTNHENYGGNYSKLDLRWHTGIRMGAQPGYGGIRFYNNEDFGARIMSIGESDGNVRIDNNLWIGGAGGWITDLLAGKQAAGSYAASSHNHDGVYAPLNHTHSNYLGTSDKAADSEKLDGIDSTGFLRSNNQSNLTSTIVVDQNGDSGNIVYEVPGGCYIPKPLGGTYKTTASSFTGSIAVMLPTASWNQSDMLSFWVDIFDYAGGNNGESVSVYVYGYQYSTGNWTNCGATVYSPRNDRDYTVRFGNDGTRHIVYIGETTSTWNYLQIAVRDFQAGYSASYANYAQAFYVDIVTAHTNVQQTSSGNYPVAKQLGAARTIALGGDVSGSASFDGSAGITITATVADDSHNHVISNVDGLQAALDGKSSTSHNHDGVYLPIGNKAADSYLVAGLDVHAGRNNEANKVVRTDSNGYIQAGWINTTSGNNGTTAIDRIYASHDGYIRYYTPANFRAQITDGIYAPVSHTHSEYLTSLPAHDHDSRYMRADTDANTAGAIRINGSYSYGTYTSASNYKTGADNLVLKGNANGVSGIFFESEKDGTNINHPSDFGFIQYSAYGTGTSGESNELVIGVSNDGDDHLVLNAPDVNGLKFRIGASTTDNTVYHSGNLSLATLGYTGATNANYITNNNQLTNGAGYITGLSWAALTGKPTSFSPSAHTHSIAEVTGLQGALDGKQPAGSYATAAQGAKADTALQSLPGHNLSGHTNDGTYNIFDTWLRENGDNNNFRIYGNSRQVIFRTDGTGGGEGHTGYPFKWTYGGDATSNTRMLLNTDGTLWTSNYGWLHTKTWAAATTATTATNVDNGNTYTTGNNLYIKNSGVNNYRVHHNGSNGVFDVYNRFSIRDIGTIWSAAQFESGSWMSFAWFDIDPWGDNWGVGSRPTSWKTVNRGSFLTFGFEDWSDRRSKSAIVEIDNAVEKVKAIGGYTYWKIGSEVREAGVIAQDVLEVFPEAIGGTEEGYSVKPAALIGLLSKAIKEQQDLIDSLTARIEALENK